VRVDPSCVVGVSHLGPCAVREPRALAGP